jgi:hypothetical protein
MVCVCVAGPATCAPSRYRRRFGGPSPLQVWARAGSRPAGVLAQSTRKRRSGALGADQCAIAVSDGDDPLVPVGAGADELLAWREAALSHDRLAVGLARPTALGVQRALGQGEESEGASRKARG